MIQSLHRLRTWLRAEDHYYWITSHLAARGVERATRRLVSAVMLGLGLIPLLLMLSDSGPTGPTNRTLAVVVSACCVVMAAMWLRPRWPTRLQSQSCVVVGSICVALACLVDAHPALGLVGVSAFIVLSAFTALFHDLRLLAFTWAVGAATLIALAARLGTVEPFLAFCGIVLFTLANVFVVFVCRSIIRLVDKDFHFSELEPLTGLLTRDAFAARAATLISARDRREDRFVAIIVVSMDSFSLLTAINGVDGGRQARVAIGRRIAETLRRDTVLAHVGESEYLIADTFTTASAAVLTERLQQTVRTAPFRLTASIGVVTTSVGPLADYSSHDVIEELIALATTNMYTARRAGGQRTHATNSVKLSPNDDAISDDLDGLP